MVSCTQAGAYVPRKQLLLSDGCWNGCTGCSHKKQRLCYNCDCVVMGSESEQQGRVNYHRNSQLIAGLHRSITGAASKGRDRQIVPRSFDDVPELNGDFCANCRRYVQGGSSRDSLGSWLLSKRNQLDSKRPRPRQ